MGRAQVLALVVLAILAGCPAGTTTDGTVTPAPVPTSTESTTQSSCSVPAPEPTSADPSTPVPAGSIPVDDGGEVNATALVERHDRTLRNHSYHLYGPGLLVEADPAGPALRVRVHSPSATVRTYVVEGTRYTYRDGPGGQEEYAVHTDGTDGLQAALGSTVSLTGREWLAGALAVGPHRPADGTASGWRLLRAAVNGSVDAGTEESGGQATGISSTVVVDHRGIIRSVHQNYRDVGDDGDVRTRALSFTVTGVGHTTVDRPAWVCIADRNGRFPDP
jgi:hypothetical protein